MLSCSSERYVQQQGETVSKEKRTCGSPNAPASEEYSRNQGFWAACGFVSFSNRGEERSS